jgi:hypothetical protein
MTSLIFNAAAHATPKFLRLMGITHSLARETFILSLKLVWLLFFVLVLIPLAWLAIEVVNHR